MAALTAPYAADVEERISGPVGHVCRVVAYPMGGEPLSLAVGEVARVTFDESWAPHIQAKLELAAADAAALQEVLDPRFRCRIEIHAGYVYGGGVEDVHPLARLHVRTVDGSLALEADSDEGLAQDARHAAGDGYPPKSGINELVAWAASKALYPETAEVVSDFPHGYAQNSFTELELEPGSDYWELISDAAARAGVWVHVGDDGRWYIKARPRLSARSAVNLHAGPGGTVTSPIETSLDRDGFRNHVQIRYVWQDEERNDYQVTGTASVPGAGRLGVDRIGRLSHDEERQGPATQSQADAAAQTVLSYLLTRGSGVELEAVAAYWLRPGMTTTIQPRSGSQLRHLVQAVTFDLLAGLMTIQTRQPDTL